MKRVDTTYWKVFRIEDLFDVVKGRRLTKADMLKGRTNYIGATAFSNGITAKIGNSEYIHPAGTITVCYNGSIGQTFYQEDSFWATDDVNVLYPKFTISKYIALFICPIIYKISLNYAYTDKWTAEKMRVSKLYLPSTPSGDPDWEYMENYMRKLEQRTQNTISAFVSSKCSPQKIDTTYWKEFSMKQLGFENFHGKRLNKADRIEGNIPFVTAGKENQGVVGEIGNKRTTYLDPITIDMFGNVFYHRGEYAGDDNVYFFVNNHLKELCKLFLVVSIQSHLGSVFEYKDQFRQDNADNLKILLPATPAGEPDWKYMEMYMRGVEAMTKEKISLLTKKKQEPVQQTNLVNYGTVNIYEK